MANQLGDTQMKLTKLLAGAAVAALVTGAASAQYTVVPTDTSAFAAIVYADTGTPNLVARSEFAEEIDFTGGLDLEVGFGLQASSTTSFTTDDVLLTITLQNATFDGNVTAANFGSACAGALGVSSGGLNNSSSVTLLISGIDGCTAVAPVANASHISAFLPITWDGQGDLDISTTLVTDSGNTPVDGGSASTSTGAATAGADNFGELVNAYQMTFAADAVSTTADLDATPIYTAFQGGAGFDAVLGTVALACDTTAVIGDLSPVACNGAQVVDTDVVITGDMIPYTNAAFLAGQTGNVTVGGLTTGVIAADQGSIAVDIDALIAGANGFAPALGSIALVADGDDAISRGGYSISGTLNLGAGLVDEAYGPAALQSVDREGSSIEFPWVAGAAVASNNGSTNFFRIANQSNQDARLFVEVLTSTDAAFVNPGTIQLNNVPAGGEVIYTSDTLTTELGSDFGRGDVLFTVEALSGDVSARRLVLDANGSLTEVGGREIGQNDNF
jgi:hypothetical protein